MKILTLCLLTLWLSGFIPAAPAADDGKALLERTCTQCHSLDGVWLLRNSKERWSSIVDDMVSRGAEASDAELEQIVEYLAKTQGPRVNVNKATADALAGVLEIPKGAAAAIVEYREKNGDFKSAEDLRKVPGLDAKDIESKKDRLDFTGTK